MAALPTVPDRKHVRGVICMCLWTCYANKQDWQDQYVNVAFGEGPVEPVSAPNHRPLIALLYSVSRDIPSSRLRVTTPACPTPCNTCLIGPSSLESSVPPSIQIPVSKWQPVEGVFKGCWQTSGLMQLGGGPSVNAHWLSPVPPTGTTSIPPTLLLPAPSQAQLPI